VSENVRARERIGRIRMAGWDEKVLKKMFDVENKE
jgi:hypothetical protein